MTGRPEAGSARYWAWLYSPPRLRAVLEPLLALEAEVGAALAQNLDHQIAHVRLEWWRQEYARYGQGAPVHPLTRALLAACVAAPAAPQPSPPRPPDRGPVLGPDDQPAPPARLPDRPDRLNPNTMADPDARPDAGSRPNPLGLVDTATWDLAAATFATRAELTAYCDRWASAVTEVAAAGAAPVEAAPAGTAPLELTAASAAPPEPTAAARDPAGDAMARFGRSVGGPLREIELLLALDADARRGRLRLPLDELEREGVDPSALSRLPWPAALCRLLREHHQAARAALERSTAELPPSHQPALRGLIVWAAVVHRRSMRAERGLPRPLQDGVTSRLAEVGLSWRAARRADRREFHL